MSTFLRSSIHQVAFVICLLGLWMMAGQSSAQPFASSSSVVINIVDEGAKGDGKFVNTPIFKRIIATKCAAGCTIVVPAAAAGKEGGNQQQDLVFLTGPFNLTSNVELRIEKGAQVLGQREKEGWAVVSALPSFGRGREIDNQFRYAPLIGCFGCKNVHISGQGTIDGNGDYWWTLHKEHKLQYTRPRLVEFYECVGVWVESVMMQNSPFWTLHPVYSRDILIEHIHIYNPQWVAPNADGIDPNSCENVVIRHCRISTSDDNISIKSGWDQAGIKFGMPSRNISIYENSFILGAGMAIGSEMSGGVENVHIHNNLYAGTANSVRIKSGYGRGGYIRNVIYENEKLDGVAIGVYFNLLYAKHGNHSVVPVIENIQLRHLKGVVGRAGQFDCLPEAQCHLAEIDQIHLVGALGWQCDHVKVDKIGKVYPRFCL